ncbi:hypothetical protein N5C43_09225 [Comamonas terrigena]|uniref:hypothetical protein n=1 Tax=Comamonas terrigena TaxID=32013 RepID=UPI00244AAC23|nr:hypothetical protein [Comamonas terrigena]MDH1291436.1 hypothetical protein [Comamonas terrigena]
MHQVPHLYFRTLARQDSPSRNGTPIPVELLGRKIAAEQQNRRKHPGPNGYLKPFSTDVAYADVKVMRSQDLTQPKAIKPLAPPPDC